ncbi:MAG TPA: type I-E CRISPR-associated endoribonuclease Cas2e [Polyangiaceae bacterium LLY-WYZ-15_(1-7)]|nr:type I-E CRISPR-associated endoribonuclease Cas2e [Polyangiaceae bacterium LLY-WYZ-15_(1-7)]HJL06423.1 type I-E CRISPR-associated endoribonuclease Cas2e [Polyangiaceae bacterium LLY-WYZ-15_(1-7)]HJL10323.1 type I-E CRISPR-associated endoribonuclease Cas2e [Polyangiaceae bacterium LLY-WYZ-15_(1-7)]HJL24833.1 type I-E CRISPR-associated endoribonuclease Cas2e [Polyangiaceae bacterium LLY-WYZ-15_(1-7)]HJL33874.1 type I-E CRISPR-associated endoribonuclease Cas2e [Polyangiaceae bacterium LLY-WYZ-1
MTVVATRNVAPRVRGFLASVMCEVAPGVYTAPRMSAAVRERVWRVLRGWCSELTADQGLVMTWPDRKLPGGQEIRVLGGPPYELVEHDGVYLARTDLTQDERFQLARDADEDTPF